MAFDQLKFTDRQDEVSQIPAELNSVISILAIPWLSEKSILELSKFFSENPDKLKSINLNDSQFQNYRVYPIDRNDLINPQNLQTHFEKPLVVVEHGPFRVSEEFVRNLKPNSV
jgi:hypothetical protein